MPRAERESRMLDAAGTAFARHGFHGASMDAIAAASGISKPMLYNYFGSKEGLYSAYVSQSGRALVAGMRDAAPPDAAAEERLTAGISTFLDYVDEHRTGWRVLYNEIAAQGGPLAAEVAALRSRVVDMVGRAIGNDQSSEAFAHALVGAGESLANWWLVHPDVPKEELVDLLLRLAGIVKTPSRPANR
jgi:AcrR family transcriptional regulator